jgi:hypothetical protein
MTEATRARGSALPVDRAFVVQFRPETSLAADQLLAFVGQVPSESSIETKGAPNT